MRTYLFLFLSIIALGTACAQERSFIHKKFEHFTVDLLDNFYGWTGDRLEKYNTTGDIVSSYSNKSLGTITHVDASIPSKILVFHQESGTIQFLDNKLSPIGNSINLFDKELFFISLVALLNSNTITLYDFSSQKLIISDLDLNIKHTISCDFSKDFNPNLINTFLDKEILLIDQSGLYFFDKFGSFEKRIAVPDIFLSQLNKDILFYVQQNKLYQYNLLTLDMGIIPTNVCSIKEFHISNHNLYILDYSGEIFKHQIKK